MKTTNIKPKNLAKILALLTNEFENCIQGSQYEAFLRLLDRKGYEIECEDKTHELHGLICLLLPNGKCIAIQKFPTKNPNVQRIRVHLFNHENQHEQ